MAAVLCGPNLKDYSYVSSNAYKEAIKHFNPEPKGEGTEAYVNWLFSLFNDISFMSVEKGSQLDLAGVDLLFRGSQGPTVGVQIKSSKAGIQHFRSNGTLSESIILMWVNCKSNSSRFKLFLELWELLESYGASLTPEVEAILNLRNKMVDANITSLPIHRGRVNGVKMDDLKVLMHLGLVKKADKAFKFLLTEGEVRN